MSSLAHKICLSPSAQQEKAFRSFAGCHRAVYNFLLDSWRSWWWAYENSEKTLDKPNWPELKRTFNALRRELFPWMAEPLAAHRYCWSQPWSDLKNAYSAYFKKKGAAPRFKSRRNRWSFYVANDKLRFKGKKVRIPKVGWVKMREALRFKGKVLGARVVRESNGCWFVCVQVEADHSRERLDSKGLGIDLGIKNAMVLSEPLVDGRQVFNAPKPLKRALRRLAKAQRIVSRRKKGSNRRAIAQRRVGRLYFRTRNIRNDWIHKTTTSIICESQAVGIEDLNVLGMQKNHKLSRALADVAMGEMRRQITYKAELYGTKVVLHDRWFPSSKTCSACGNIKAHMGLEERTHKCDKCGLSLDRDVNAALNLTPGRGAAVEKSAAHVRRGSDRGLGRELGDVFRAPKLENLPLSGMIDQL